MYACQCVLYSAHSHACLRPLREGAMEEKKMDNPQAIAQAVVAALLSLTAQPAATVTQAVVSVAKTGQRRISQAVKDKVKAMRVRNGGSVPNGVPCWQLIDDGIIDADGNYIADAEAPTKQSNRKAKITQADAAKMNRADIAQHISRKDLLALLE